MAVRPVASARVPLRVPLVERAAASAVLRDVRERVAAGQGLGLLISGQPGVGKTALLTDALAEARSAGFTVVCGQAHAAERGLGYAVVVDALGPDLEVLGSGRAVLTRGLPELGRLFRGATTTAAADGGATARQEVREVGDGRRGTGDPALDRMRLVDALGRLFEQMTSRAPVLFAVDDLHWADPASLQVVHHLLRRMQGDRFLFLATARDGESGESGESGNDYDLFLASARRLALLDEVRLEPLSSDGVAAMLAGLLPAAQPGTDLIRLVYRRSGGIPLFVSALTQSLADAGWLVAVDGMWELARDASPQALTPLTPAASRLLTDRLRRLEPDARAVLDILAVHDAPMEHMILCTAVGTAEADVLDALRKLRAVGMVQEDADGANGTDVTYAVSHALLAEAATADMAAVVRRRAHLAVAEALQQAGSAAVEAMARHLRAAGPLVGDDRVVPVLLAAADTATGRGDFRLAADHLGEAVTRLRAAADRQELQPLIYRFADALYRSGRLEGAASAWQECLEAAEQDGDSAACVALRRRLATAERDRGRLETAVAHLDAATAAARGTTHAPTGGTTCGPAGGRAGGTAHGPVRTAPTPAAELLLAGSLADRFTLAERMEDLTAAEAAASDLEELARGSSSRLVKIEAALTRAGLELARQRLGPATAAAVEALAGARAVGDPELEQRALSVAVAVALESGAPADVRRHADAALDLARCHGIPALKLRAFGSRCAAGLFDGDWRGCDRDVVQVLALARAFDIPRGLAAGLAMRALLHLHRGDTAAAEAAVGEAGRHQAAVPDDRHVASDVAHARCRLALERGDAARARDLVPALLRPGGRIVVLRRMTAAEALILSGLSADALAVVDLLLAGSPSPYQRAVADRVAGLAHRALGDEPAAGRHLAAAADSFTEQGLPYWGAVARLEFAECVVQAEPARALAQESLDTLEDLGARRAADRARRLLRRLGARPRPAARPATPRGPLSARELEVARLFADGLTTAEVAARLVLSPHTVTAHLRRIYERLGVRSRATLTRTLAEAGLLTPSVHT